MTLDPFVIEKLESIRHNFNALTERLADPDVANNRKLMLSLSRERASSEQIVNEYTNWLKLDSEMSDLQSIQQEPKSDHELKEIAREEEKLVISRQDEIEKKITLLLLPKDSNDDRNVMLEIRSG